MADNIYQVRLQGSSMLPRDVYENVLCYETNAPDTVQGTCNEIRDLYRNAAFLVGFSTVEVRAYDMAGGQPIAAAAPMAPAAIVAATVPHEVAVCLSYASVNDPAQSTSRRRGRIFLGPVGGNGAAAVRPGAAFRGLVLTFGEALAAVGTAGNTTWKLWSRTDASTHKIESIWVDDSWDTQRRRGLSPTLRDVRDVQ